MGQTVVHGRKYGGLEAALKLALQWSWAKELEFHNLSPFTCPVGGSFDERSGEDEGDEKNARRSMRRW